MAPAWRTAGMLEFFAPDPFSQEISMPKASSKAASPRRATRTKSSSTELAQATTPTLQHRFAGNQLRIERGSH